MIKDFLDIYRDNPDYDQLEIQALHDYFYHLFMKEGSSEYCLMMLFDSDLHPYLPLMVPSKLQNPSISFPVSIIVGEDDWVQLKMFDAGKQCVKLSS